MVLEQTQGVKVSWCVAGVPEKIGIVECLEAPFLIRVCEQEE